MTDGQFEQILQRLDRIMTAVEKLSGTAPKSGDVMIFSGNDPDPEGWTGKSLDDDA